MSGKLYYWVADWNLSRAQAVERLASPVWNMVDCTHASVDKCRFTDAEVMAGYVTGTPDIRWTTDDFLSVQFHGVTEKIVIRIDQSNTDLPLLADTTLVKDIEPGASTDPVAIEVAKTRIEQHGEDYMLYIEASQLAALERMCDAARLPHGEIVAYQYASPSSDPGLRLPGPMTPTLEDCNADLSVIKRSAYHVPHPPRPAEPSPAHAHSLARARISHGTIGGKSVSGEIQLDLRNMRWSSIGNGDIFGIEPLPWGD